MKKTLLLISSSCLLLLLGCWNNESRQWNYYSWWIDDTDIVRWPIFSNYEWCKNRAHDMEYAAYNWYVRCSKNCKDSKWWTIICEEVVRSRHPLPWFWVTFDEYKK